ncbi:hypothetical protein [Sediminitomix flava]|uniref:Phosphate-selective porin O/P n=1 Tax=Sediminitomix flava TaxID=379075 RepID=A0A315ZEM4_SEDFL|nr:hypothetical protein [Sediminitomix flava]PWJ43782.1 hypothetical protein BC781_101128 [Sediminitomix flava]
MKLKVVSSLLALFLFLSLGVKAQSSIKLEKQQTRFFYGQLNLHGGYHQNQFGEYWDFSSVGPRSQLALQYFAKNRRILQKGYTRAFALASSKARFSLAFDKRRNDQGESEGSLYFQAVDLWMKFNTKWDRTTITIGQTAIPYGHNPSIDPIINFAPNLVSSDLGFSRDLGLFLKSPISQKMQLEFSFTSGGLLNQPLVTCENLVKNRVQHADPVVRFEDVEYRNTWLGFGRLGTQSYLKYEFGLIGGVGKINSKINSGTTADIWRGGADFSYKFEERFKFSSMITYGENSEINEIYKTVNTQQNVDILLWKRFVLRSSYSLLVQDQRLNKDANYAQVFANSIGYNISPHTKIRLNYYWEDFKRTEVNPTNVYIQFVTGIGKRP